MTKSDMAGIEGRLRRTLTAKAAQVAVRYEQTLRGGRDRPPATGPPPLGVVVTGLFEPSEGLVSRLLPAAAQQGRRTLPCHRWMSDDQTMELTLAENGDGRLVATVVSSRPDPELLVSLEWATVSAAGRTMAALVTPLPGPAADGKRTVTYDVGGAAELHSFGIDTVAVLSAGALSPAAVDDAFSVVPYGNAVRAWDQYTARVAVPELRAALERHLQTPS